MQINSKIYFDNAATTALAPEVLETMTQVLKDNFGNPSSQHSFGRASKSILETTRKKIAEYLGVSASEIFFTSGGTEADNTALIGAVESLGVKHIISSKIKHHAVLHTLEYLQQKKGVRVSYVALDNKGYVDYQNLEELLKNSSEKTLVSLMHANNEIKTLLDLEKVGNLCEKYNALFHSDTVQTLGHYRVEPKKYKLHFLVASAHKFHGPKGVGFLYVDNKIKIDSFIHGGSQEKNKRGGTENLYGIAGLGKALELALLNVDEHQKEVKILKNEMIRLLNENFEGIAYNTDVENESLYTVLNVAFPYNDKSSMLLFHLDMKGIAASGGSACTSGASTGSHVLTGINAIPNQVPVRFSFSRMNTLEEVHKTIEVLKEILK